MTSPSRVFVARLARAEVFDPKADQVGRVRDGVVGLRADSQPPRVVGLVVEELG
ncbi:MAG: magnesium transporter, partial [Candidatus Nanopelagicales bacterium]